MPTVSVIIPTYKHREFVLATLDSVFAQTFTDYEVIIINDGSPDDTAEVLKPLVEAGRIRYFAQENAGQSRARNRGIQEAQGEFIALLDDDDLWPPDKLQWQVDAMTRWPDAGVVAGTADVVDVSGRHIYRTAFIPEVLFEGAFAGCPFISPGQTLIRTRVLRNVDGLNADIWGADDWDLWLRLAKISRILVEERNALFYRMHAGNASGDVCRMLDNSFRVVDIHLADVAAKDRRTAKLRAYNWLYFYAGGRLVAGIKQAARSGELRRLSASLARLARLGTVLGRDPVAVLRVARDFLPARWSYSLYRRG